MVYLSISLIHYMWNGNLFTSHFLYTASDSSVSSSMWIESVVWSVKRLTDQLPLVAGSVTRMWSSFVVQPCPGRQNTVNNQTIISHKQGIQSSNVHNRWIHTGFSFFYWILLGICYDSTVHIYVILRSSKQLSISNGFQQTNVVFKN